MKLSALFFTLTLVVTLNANQTILEKYTALRNDSELAKVEAKRNLLLETRDQHHKFRDYRDAMRDMREEALFVRIENSYIPYR